MDGYVIHVNHYTPFVDEVAEYCIHHGLEGGGGVGQAEEHNCGFVKSFVSDEGRLPAVFRLDEYFVIPPFNVETSEQRTVS